MGGRPFVSRSLFVALLATLVTGCGLPTPLVIVSYAVDGVSLAATGKTVTDHAISEAAGRDCRLWRMVQGHGICSPRVGPGEVVLLAEGGTVDRGPLPPPETARIALPPQAPARGN